MSCKRSSVVPIPFGFRLSVAGRYCFANTDQSGGATFSRRFAPRLFAEADKQDTGSAQGVFCRAPVAAENGSHRFHACGRETLRGFLPRNIKLARVFGRCSLNLLEKYPPLPYTLHREKRGGGREWTKIARRRQTARRRMPRVRRFPPRRRRPTEMTFTTRSTSTSRAARTIRAAWNSGLLSARRRATSLSAGNSSARERSTIAAFIWSLPRKRASRMSFCGESARAWAGNMSARRKTTCFTSGAET